MTPDPLLVWFVALLSLATSIGGLLFGYAERQRRKFVASRLRNAWESVADQWAEAPLTPNERRLVSLHMRDLEHYWKLLDK